MSAELANFPMSFLIKSRKYDENLSNEQTLKVLYNSDIKRNQHESVKFRVQLVLYVLPTMLLRLPVFGNTRKCLGSFLPCSSILMQVDNPEGNQQIYARDFLMR